MHALIGESLTIGPSAPAAPGSISEFLQYRWFHIGGASVITNRSCISAADIDGSQKPAAAGGRRFLQGIVSRRTISKSIAFSTSY